MTCGETAGAGIHSRDALNRPIAFEQGLVTAAGRFLLPCLKLENGSDRGKDGKRGREGEGSAKK